MFKIKDKVEEMNKLMAEIRFKLDNKLIVEAGELLKQYQKICKNPDYYLLKADFYLLSDDIDSAMAVLNECKEKFPFNVEADKKIYKYTPKNYYNIRQHFLNIFSWFFYKLYVKTREYIVNNKKLENVMRKNLEKLRKIFPLDMITDRGNISGRYFPIGKSNKSLILQTIKDESGQEWLINNYRESSGIAASMPLQNSKKLLRYFWNTETIKGKTIEKEVSLEPYLQKETICIPICTLNNNNNSIFEFNIDGKELRKEFKFIDKRFYHTRIDNAKNIKIKSPGDFFIGTPRIMRHNPNLKKLVLYIFVDSLSAKYLQEKSIEQLMPNTNKFFQRRLPASKSRWLSATGRAI